MILWSLLIAGVPERFHSVHKLLLGLLEHQAVARMPDVELIYLLDNKRRSIGSKRNSLIAASCGEYISFLDDDDEVATDYVQKIYRAICTTRRTDNPPDVVCFNQRATIMPAGVIHECSYSLDHYRNREPDKRRQLAVIVDEQGNRNEGALAWTGPPAHTCVWKRSILEGLKFQEKNFGEDVAFVDAACERAKAEIQIPGSPLYFYKYNEATSLTRG